MIIQTAPSFKVITTKTVAVSIFIFPLVYNRASKKSMLKSMQKSNFTKKIFLSSNVTHGSSKKDLRWNFYKFASKMSVGVEVVL